MTYTVTLTVQAQRDISEIFEYIALELLSPENAASQIDRLEDSIARLDHTPHRFARYGKEPWKRRGLRFVSVDNYSVFYIPDDEKMCVTVIRVMYSARDVDAQLGQTID